MKKKKKFSDIILSIIFIAILVYSAYVFGFRILNNHFVGNNAIYTKAVIINDKNYYPNQNVKPEFSYSYEFEVNGKIYKGDSHDKKLQIGDSVEVKYNKRWPSFNKPVHPKD